MRAVLIVIVLIATVCYIVCVVFVLVCVYNWQERTAVADCQANNQSNHSYDKKSSNSLCQKFCFRFLFFQTKIMAICFSAYLTHLHYSVPSIQPTLSIVLLTKD